MLQAICQLLDPSGLSPWLRRAKASCCQQVIRRFLAAVLLVVAGWSSLAVASEATFSREEQFKSAYLVNFLKFVDWPATTPADSLMVCFIGGSGVAEALGVDLDAKSAGARRLIIRRLRPADTATGCNVLYVDASAGADARTSSVSDQPVLTVSDAKAFAAGVGIIELFPDNNRLRFNINAAHAQRVGLRIKSSLLNLAASVEKSERP